MKIEDVISGRQSINYAWQKSGSCKTKKKFVVETGEHVPFTYPDFYPDTGKSVTDEVKELCDNCPVKEKCLDHAISHEKYGYWGGTSESQREILRKQRKIVFRSPQSNAWLY